MNTIKDAKTALAGHTLSTEAVNVINEAARLLREDPMNTPTDKSRSAEVEYCAAYFDFLNGKRIKPTCYEFGLAFELTETLKGQCRTEMNRQLDAKGPAVTFTEQEARQAATDLRDIANTLCEIPLPDDEKTCRLLAQKFDTWRKES